MRRAQAAAAAGQRCIVCGHLPLCPGTCAPACLLWNYEEVLGVLRRSDCVAATIAGHAHQNGYVVDEWGIHHVVSSAGPEGAKARGQAFSRGGRLHMGKCSLRGSLEDRTHMAAILS